MEKQTRTIRVPVGEVLGYTHKEFYADLRAAIMRCTAAANRCLIECAKVDEAAMGAVAMGNNIPKLNKSYKNLGKRLYDAIKGGFQGSTNVAANIVRACAGKYCSERFQILTGKRSLPTQRTWPLPLLHNKSTRMVKFWTDTDDNVFASFRLLGDRVYSVRLRGGSNYRRQLQTIKASLALDEIGDSKIWIDRHGAAVIGVACKILKATNNGTGTLRVHTAIESFIVATKEQNETPFVINADHVHRWQAERLRVQQRLRQDRKSGTSRSALIARQRTVSTKYRQRLDSFTHEAASHIVSHARRRRVAVLEYDGTIKSYFGNGFPWHEFETKLQYKCEAAGIEFVKSTREMRPAEQDEPHVYFDLGIDIATGEPRNVKIGRTGRQAGKRASDDARARDQNWITLATHATTKNRLCKLEKHYLAMFASHKINGEMFRREPVIQWLREVGCLGNSGNLSQIMQHVEVNDVTPKRRPPPGRV